MAIEECNHLQKNQDHSGSNVNVRILGYIPRPTACLLREQQVWKEGIQRHMALGHEEFPLDMVQLLLLGTRRCLSCEMSKCQKKVGSLCNSYISVYMYICIYTDSRGSASEKR